MADISKISPDDGSTFLDIKDANGRVMSEQLTRDTVGWTGKNICDITQKTQIGTANIIYNGTEITMSSSVTYPNFLFGDYIPAGNYVLSVNVKSSNSSQARIGIKKGNAIEQTINFGTSTGKKTKTINVPSDNEYKVCVFINMETANNSTIVLDEIMLYDARIVDDTYEPYHDTVEDEITDAYKVMGELTDAVTPVDIASELTVEIGTLNNGASKILKTGRLITLSMQLTGVTANANQALAKLPKKYRPVNNIQFFGGIILSGEDNLRQVAYTSTTDYLEFQCPYAISNKTVTFITVSWIIQ